MVLTWRLTVAFTPCWFGWLPSSAEAAAYGPSEGTES
jgi:hypothetical protein